MDKPPKCFEGITVEHNRKTMGKPWDNYGKPWENHGITMENHGITMGSLWDNYGKLQENHQDNYGKP